MDAKTIYQQVNKHYGHVAESSSVGRYGQVVAQAFGYSLDELATIPQDANLGLSCGNPLAIANLKRGETVIDLGSGAGFDVFLAAKHVGPDGQAIGVDMNKEMLSKATFNKEKANAINVSFVESRITSVCLRDSMADCIVSNCVINLVPEAEKQKVFAEMFRLLKPGGRVAISDILIKKNLSRRLKHDMTLYVGCLAGASPVAQYETYLQAAGFTDILIVDSGNDLNVYRHDQKDGTRSMSSCCGNSPAASQAPSCSTSENLDEPSGRGLTEEHNDVDFNEWAGSYKIYALKPDAA